MSFNELFKVYPNKNIELRALAKQAYEFGRTVAQEQTAAVSLGVDPHALARQRSYVTLLEGKLKAFYERPLPDMPYVHPIRFDIDLSKPYDQFTQDGLALNEDTQLLAEYWMIIAVELAASQSAGMAGTILEPDYNRIIEHLGTITQYLDEVETGIQVDLPETAFPGAVLETPQGSGSE